MMAHPAPILMRKVTLGRQVLHLLVVAFLVVGDQSLILDPLLCRQQIPLLAELDKNFGWLRPIVKLSCLGRIVLRNEYVF